MPEQQRTDHALYHRRWPSVGCQLCHDEHEQRISSRVLGASGYRCPGYGHIVYTLEIISRSPTFVARTTCLECNKQVPATRPTRACPWALVGAHKAAP